MAIEEASTPGFTAAAQIAISLHDVSGPAEHELHSVRGERVEQAVQEVLHWVKDPAQLSSWEELLPHMTLQSCEAESSFCRADGPPEAAGPGGRPSKRRRTSPPVLGATTAAQPDSSAASAPPPSPADAALATAASQHLSYPLTALDSFLNVEALSDVVRRRRTFMEPLHITVVGASSAETTHLEAWQVRLKRPLPPSPPACAALRTPARLRWAAALLTRRPLPPPLLQLLQRGLDVRLRLVFVGPELPAALHLSTQRAGRDVTASFFKVRGPRLPSRARVWPTPPLAGAGGGKGGGQLALRWAAAAACS
jgi:hypothetical protein